MHKHTFICHCLLLLPLIHFLAPSVTRKVASTLEDVLESSAKGNLTENLRVAGESRFFLPEGRINLSCNCADHVMMFCNRIGHIVMSCNCTGHVVMFCNSIGNAVRSNPDANIRKDIFSSEHQRTKKQKQ